MILQFGKEIEHLQAVDAQGLEEIVIRGKLFPGHFEMGSGEVEDIIPRLVGDWHMRSLRIVSRDHSGSLWQIRLRVRAFRKFLQSCRDGGPCNQFAEKIDFPR